MNIKKILVLLCFTVAIIGIIAPVNAAVESISTDDTAYTVESKEKTAKLRLTWNANGGKIGTKNSISTTVKKGSKIGTLPKNLKLTGHTFKGWYTKRNGGTKISANTKINKNVVLYAQWKKVNTISNANTQSKIIGRWTLRNDEFDFSSGYTYYDFKKNGNFEYYSFNYHGDDSLYTTNTTGKYNVNNGKLYLTNAKTQKFDGTREWPHAHSSSQEPNVVKEFKIGRDNQGEYLFMQVSYKDTNTDPYPVKFRKNT